jgi:nucleotide-binding universal stress UspA family protein
MYERILIPTDGSEHAAAAAETAFELADALDAAVYAVSIAELGPLGSVRLPGDEASAEEVLRARAEEFVSRVAAQGADRGLAVTTAVRQGTPVTEILDYADEIEADVVVMGTKGRGGVSRLMLGSVTDAVTRFGDVDVLVADVDVPAED